MIDVSMIVFKAITELYKTLWYSIGVVSTLEFNV